MNENLKVSFWLKRERKEGKNGNTVYPVVGKIIYWAEYCPIPN
jgi:hypothetical protein